MYNKNLATGDTLLSQKNKTVNKNNKKKELASALRQNLLRRKNADFKNTSSKRFFWCNFFKLSGVSIVIILPLSIMQTRSERYSASSK